MCQCNETVSGRNAALEESLCPNREREREKYKTIKKTNKDKEWMKGRTGKENNPKE
jgi:hypothetical protein